MTKKLAELLLKHKADSDKFDVGRSMDEQYFNSSQYKTDYREWEFSGQQCLAAIEAYGNDEYLASFYGNGKYNIYTIAEKYLNKLAKNRLQKN